MNTIKYTQENFNTDIKRLVSKLNHQSFDLIVGINRGGCIPAVCLSHALKIPVTMIDYSTRDGVNIHPENVKSFFFEQIANYRNVLLVDDIIDSGKSAKKLIQETGCGYNRDVTFATLLYNTDVDFSTVDVVWGTSFSRTTEPRYFDFWWETYNV